MLTKKSIYQQMFRMKDYPEMVQKGMPDGNRLVKQILDLGISKYKLAKDIGVSITQVGNWCKNHASPNEINYMRLKEYLVYAERYAKFKEFKPVL